MRKLIYFLIMAFLVICLPDYSESQITRRALKIQEEDGTPSGKPKTLKVTNSTLTDNGDGTWSLTTGGGGGGGTELIWEESNATPAVIGPLTASSTLSVSNDVTLGNGAFYVNTANTRVGIGTTTPDARLEIGGAGGELLHIDGTNIADVAIDRAGTNQYATLHFENSGSTQAALGMADSDNFGDGADFFIGSSQTTGTPWVVIDVGTGNVGISNNSPNQELDVTGDILVSSDITVTGDAYAAAFRSSSVGQSIYGNNGSNGHYFKDGDVGIDEDLTVEGYIQVTSFHDMSLDFDVSRSDGFGTTQVYMVQDIAPFDLTINQVQLFSDLTPSSELTVQLFRNTTSISTIDVGNDNKIGTASSENDSITSGQVLAAQLTGVADQTDLTNTGTLRIRYLRTSEV